MIVKGRDTDRQRRHVEWAIDHRQWAIDESTDIRINGLTESDYFHKKMNMFRILLLVGIILLLISCRDKNESSQKMKTTDTINGFKRQAWVSHANIYEVNVRQYTPQGNFKSFGNH